LGVAQRGEVDGLERRFDFLPRVFKLGQFVLGRTGRDDLEDALRNAFIAKRLPGVGEVRRLVFAFASRLMSAASSVAPVEPNVEPTIVASTATRKVA
jgi:hypothetical protein